MTPVIPFRVSEFNGARPHQAAQHDRKGMPVGLGLNNYSGVGITHVRDGKALTPKGALLLQRFGAKVS